MATLKVFGTCEVAAMNKFLGIRKSLLGTLTYWGPQQLNWQWKSGIGCHDLEKMFRVFMLV